MLKNLVKPVATAVTKDGKTHNDWTVAGATNLTFWNVLANVTLQKNVQLHAEYAFGADAENAADPDDAWTVSLNYKF